MKSIRPLLFSLFALASTAAAENAPAAFPFEPAQLLTVLPTTPSRWTLLRSEANTSLSAWLQTRATRVFQAPPPEPDSASPAVAAPAAPSLGEAEISVLDTGGFTSALAAFLDFTPGKNGNVERKQFGSLPAILTTSEDGLQLAEVLVSNRFIVRISLKNLPKSRVEDWLRTFHFDALPAKSPTPTTRPSEFRLSYVDELHPEKNRSRTASTTSSKRVREFLKLLPPETDAAKE